jgi:hypothetical protein
MEGSLPEDCGGADANSHKYVPSSARTSCAEMRAIAYRAFDQIDGFEFLPAPSPAIVMPYDSLQNKDMTV